nr:PBP1A family penicillin-binding protein [Bacillus taeanensis]
MEIKSYPIKNPWLRIGLRIAFIFAVLGFFMLGSLLMYVKLSGPPPLRVTQTTTFYGSDQSIIGEKHQNGQNRYWVGLDDISENVIHATIAIEDRKFYDHNGFDFKRIAGAIIADIKAMAKVQGASTITQQYARNLYLGHDKTWKRKAVEALYTMKLEMNYPKDKILEGYLNTIYYGHGTYGIEAAANYYFNKTAAELTLAEASILAGIPKGPAYYSPYLNQENAENRQDIILSSMEKMNFITEAEKKDTLKETLTFVSHDQPKEKVAPYFLDEVKKTVAQQLNLDPEASEAGGLNIYTTLDPVLQEKAEKWVETTIGKESELEAALVAIDPRNGEIKALVGGRDYQKSQYNRATQARRAPGSTFKPFLYYAALQKGFTPSTLLRSEKTTFRYNDDKETYTPHNYGNHYANDFITLAQALALSDNVFAVKTHMLLGLDELINTAKVFGINSPLAELPSLALGTKPVGILEMTNAYSIFANGGFQVPPSFVTKVTDHVGNVLYERELTRERVIDKKSAFVMTHLMTGMFDENLNDYAGVTGANIKNFLHRPAAGKSGTTSMDSWMIGFTPQLVTGVWIGYDQGKTLDNMSGKYAKKIWAQFMEDALQDKPAASFKPPKGVVGVMVNPDNGLLASEGCPVQRLTYYIEGTEPTEYCEEHIHEEPLPEEKAPKKEKGWLKRLLPWFN